LSYRPVKAEWQLTPLSTSLPDASGVSFMVNPQPFVATYDHTTGLWTKSNLKLINGAAVTLTAATSVPTGYALATTYYVISATGSTFQLSATLGGSPVTAATDNGTGAQTINPVHAADGQVQYTSSNISGTASYSSMSFRMRQLGGKNLLYSQAGAR